MLKSSTFSFSIFKLTTLAIIFYCGNTISQVQGDSVYIESTYGKKYTGIISELDQEGYFIITSYNREIFLSKLEIKTIKVVLELIEPNIDSKVSTLFIDSNNVNTGDTNALKEKPEIEALEKVKSTAELSEFYVKYEHTQSIEPAPSEKAVVYFVRSSMFGFAINFTYFDSTKVIGRFNGHKFLRYECDPGEHLFWARSENRDYVKADLEAGKIYVIDVIPQMGAVTARVRLVPINSSNYKMKKTQKLLTKGKSESFTERELAVLQKETVDIVARGLERYKKLAASVKTLGNLAFKPEELLFSK